MKNLDKFMDDIDSKKEEIAKVISLAFAYGDKEKAKSYFPLFYERISETKLFVFKSSSGIEKNTYARSIDDLLKNISEYVGFDASAYFYDAYLKSRTIKKHPNDDADMIKKI